MAGALPEYHQMVEPPDGASYVTAAYKPNDLQPNRLAWLCPSEEIKCDSMEMSELAQLPCISNTNRDGGRGSLLGVVYADSPLNTDASKPLDSVSVAELGVVTLVDSLFKDKSHGSAGQMVYAKGTKDGCELRLARPGGEAGWWHVGMLLEIGSRCDARILLNIRAV